MKKHISVSAEQHTPSSTNQKPVRNRTTLSAFRTTTARTEIKNTRNKHKNQYFQRGKPFDQQKWK
jgi:hypothetical protein